uniref:AAA+ ATPase domain-containing protein n=1 Tax=Leersia perrieri TaxID=77586 RepID=A0A0D9WYU1_9ORYZ
MSMSNRIRFEHKFTWVASDPRCHTPPHADAVIGIEDHRTEALRQACLHAVRLLAPALTMTTRFLVASNGVRRPGSRSAAFLHWFMIPPNLYGMRYKTLKASINTLNVKMDDILQKGSELGFLPINQEVMNERPQISLEVALDDYTVGGIQNEANKLIDILTDRKSAKTLVAIVGGSGTGKTTLAWKIHDDRRTRSAFVVTSAGGNPKEAKNRMQLELMLASMLKGKRFLLVLDDVRSHQIEENSLESLWHVYGHGSRILITTRDENVATKVNASYIHQVKKSTFQNCWSLLCHNACLNENLHGNTLRSIGIMIIQRCDKIPMAVKIVGAVLRRKEQTQEAWQRVYEFEGWSFNDLPGDIHGLTGAIYLAYHDLPSHLKQCLLYLSLFPEGSIIRQQFVSQLWISEGLIDQRDNCSAETIAEEYYEELISRNLLQLEIGNCDITRCIMHDQIRSFLQFFAKDKIFSGELNPSTNGTSNDGLRHVWISGNSPATNLEEIATVTSLKTVILYKNPLGNQGLDKLFKGLKYLHVLDLGGTEIRYIPRTLEFLVHLRLLNLSLTRITELPESIKYLTNLQFLGLRYCSWLHTLPKGISNLHKLQTLDLRGTSLHQVLPSLVNLKQLSTLHGFTVNRTPIHENDPSGWPLEHLKDLNALRSLQILKMEKLSDFSRVKEAMLEMKSQLKELEICCSNDDRLAEAGEDYSRMLKQIFDSLSLPQCLKSLKIVSYYAKHFPNWLPRLINLQRLVLSDCKFCEHMPDLSQLNQLKFLTITGCSKLLIMVQECTGATQAFPKLEQLHLKDMPKLESWTGFASGDIPSLVKFRLENCPMLKHLPDGLKYSRVLRSMQIRHADSLEVIQDLPVLTELDVQACNELKEVSNLPLLEVLMIRRCPRLEDVSGVHYLSHVRIIDKELRKIPDWLSKHAPVLQTFNIVGVSELLDRLLPNGEDWEIIRHINKVYANLLDESPFFTYTKSSADFHIDQRIGEINKASIVLVPGIAHEGPGILSDLSVEMTSQIGLPRVPVTRTSTLRRVIRRYLVPYLIMVMVVMQVLSHYLQNRSTRDIWLVQTLFIFFATVFLLLLVFLD